MKKKKKTNRFDRNKRHSYTPPKTQPSRNAPVSEKMMLVIPAIEIKFKYNIIRKNVSCLPLKKEGQPPASADYECSMHGNEEDVNENNNETREMCVFQCFHGTTTYGEDDDYDDDDKMHAKLVNVSQRLDGGK